MSDNKSNPNESDYWEARRVEANENTIDGRTPYERDRARIIHSSAFRRLQAKTQVLGINEGDFHRTRLTHSIEAAQIATGIVNRYKNIHLQSIFSKLNTEKKNTLKKWWPSRELIEAICLAHDLGHPPFGHGGERALNNTLLTSPTLLQWYKNENQPEMINFEGNAQTFRLLTKLEWHTPDHGLNLTRRTLLGVLKYPIPFSKLNPYSNSTKMEELLEKSKSPFFQLNGPNGNQ